LFLESKNNIYILKNKKIIYIYIESYICHWQILQYYFSLILNIFPKNNSQRVYWKFNNLKMK
jgi:hypothetical protein